MNHLLKYSGIDPAERFNERLDASRCASRTTSCAIFRKTMSSDATPPLTRPHAARDRRRPRRIRRRPRVGRAADHRARRRSSFPSPCNSSASRTSRRLLRERMLEADVRVIFTDLQAGSCTMASRRILRGMDDAVLIAGANLPTLLDFVFAEGRTAPRRRATRRNAGARRSPLHGGAARDAGAVSHRRPADSRAGRRRLGAAARHRVHRARRRHRRDERLGAGALSHGRAARDGRAISTPPTDAIAAHSEVPRRSAARAFCSPATSRRCAGSSTSGGVDDGQRRRNSFARRARAAASLRVPVAGRRARSCASSRRAA